MYRSCLLGARQTLVILASLTLALGGCGGSGAKLSKVTGKVTLGGQPLADALVTFSPSGGSPSAARTGPDGTYTLIYSKGINGAVVGEHTVTISTFQPAMEDPPTPAVPEKVPFKYREEENPQKVTVKSGSNNLDFSLEAGPIDPPPPAKGRTKSKAGDIRCY
jgi:hypothetical protein